MSVIFLALQLSTSTCQPDAAGGYNCTSISTPSQTQYVDTDWASIFAQRAKKQRSKAVGKMLANGDCAGAEKYALSKGDLELAQQVKGYCATR